MNSCHKISQAVEETLPVLYTPIFLGNECIVVASQNQRQLNDATVLSFCRFTANGELIPLEYMTNDPDIYNYAYNAFRAQTMSGQNQMLMLTTPSLPELKARLLQIQGQNYIHPQQQHAAMEIVPTHPFHYSKSTSTTELTSQNVSTPLCRRCGCSNPQITAGKVTTFSSCSRGCNTENVNTDFLASNNLCTSAKRLNVFEQRKLRKNFKNNAE